MDMLTTILYIILSVAVIIPTAIFTYKKLMKKDIVTRNLTLSKDSRIKKKDYKTINEFKYNKETDLIPKRKDRLICIFFSEDKGCHFIFREFTVKTKYFTFHDGLYLIDNSAIHTTRNGSRVCFYLEGISTPLKMSNIERYTEEIEYMDLYGNKQISTVEKIKGLKMDSKIMDVFCDEKFAENFTKEPATAMNLLLLILVIVNIALTGILYAVVWYFR